MANIYTEPVQSQFVPTYAPVNLDAINMGAQAMQRRQEENFMKADELQQQAMQMRKNILSQDEALFDEKVGAIRKNLDELAADGDLSDAGRQIRSLARQFNEETISGDVGKARENFQRVQEQYEKIDDTDLTGRQKDALKQLTIEGYQGVGEGGLDLSTPTDDIDDNKFLKDLLGDISPQKLVQDTDWNYRSDIGKFEKGRVKTSQVPPEIIRNVVQQGLLSSPQAMDALRQRAKIATVGRDEFVRTNEDGEVETISKKEKIDQLVEAQKENLVSIAMQKYGLPDREVTTQVTSAGSGATSKGLGNDITINRSGISVVKETNLEDIEGYLSKIDSKRATDKIGEAEEMEGTLDLALDGFVNSTDFSDEDADFLIETARKIQKIRGEGRPFAPILGSAEGGAGLASTPDTGDRRSAISKEISQEDLNRYNALKGEFNSWVDKGGGWTDTESGFDVSSDAGRAAHNRAQDTIQNSNIGNWKVYGMDDADSEEFLKEPVGNEPNALKTFEFKSIVNSDEKGRAPLMVNGYITDPETGESKRVRLQYKRDPSWRAEQLDPVDGILRQMGERGERMMKERRVEHIRPEPKHKNIVDELPSNIIPKHEFVSVKKTRDNKYQASFGQEDNIQDYTEGMFIKNIYMNNHGRSAEDLINSMNESGILTPDEIGFILDGGMIKPEGEDRDTARRIERKLTQHFNKPHRFNRKLEAIEAGATTK